MHAQTDATPRVFAATSHPGRRAGDYLRIVVLDRPAPGGPGAALLARVAAMRFAGYRTRHAGANITADPYDALSIHYLICRERGAERVPLMGFRITSARACEAAGLLFPLREFLVAGGTAEHLRALDAMLDEAGRAGEDVPYSGVWTRDPWLLADRRLRAAVWRLAPAMMVGIAAGGGCDRLPAVGLPSVGTDAFLARYGMWPVEGAGGPLPLIGIGHLAGEQGRLMRFAGVSPVAAADASRGAGAWERRVVVAPGAERAAA